MFFFLSKTLNYLAMPLTVVCICLLASFILKNHVLKKRFFVAALILLFIFTNEFISNELMRAWEIKGKKFTETQKHKLGIVLTGATIPRTFPDDRIFFTRGADRVIHTVQLYKLGLIEQILISGGSGRLIDIGEREADQFKEAMVLMGVPAEVIVIENETRNTHESAVEVKKLLEKMEVAANDCLLITSAFHMRRSLACFRKAGLDLEPFSTDFYSHDQGYYADAFFVPKLDALNIWHKLIREWVGFIAYKAVGYI